MNQLTGGLPATKERYTYLGWRNDSEEFSAYVDTEGNALAGLDRLGVVNIFVGANNTGKSRLLRALSTQVVLAFRDSAVDDLLASHNKQLQVVVSALETFFTAWRVQYFAQRTWDQVAMELAPVTHLTSDLAGGFVEINRVKALRSAVEAMVPDKNNRYIEQIQSGSIKRQQGAGPIGPDLANQIARQLAEVLAAFPLDLAPAKTGGFDKKTRYYVPILRGLRTFSIDDRDAGDIYEKKTASDYFKGNVGLSKIASAPMIWTGLSFYSRLSAMKNGPENRRNRILEFEQFLSTRFFGNEKVVLTARGAAEHTGTTDETSVVWVKIGSRAERRIFDLGDGIQTVIALTFPVFEAEAPSLFFIEEPEIGLHPALQRKLLDAWLARSEHQYFITTHSNHLLDLTLDCRHVAVFQFAQADAGSGEKFQVEQVLASDERVLQQLGVQPSSVFLSNCTIWVEGVTDRAYLRHFLTLLATKKGVQIQEDRHFVFADYAGSNLPHWDFAGDTLSEPKTPTSPICAPRLCAKAFVVADRDSGKEKKHATLKASLGKRYYCLPVREIENLLPVAVLVELIADAHGKAASQLASFPKNHETAYLGELISSWLTKQSIEPVKLKTKSGTLDTYWKNKFATSAPGKLKSFDDLTKPAQLLTKKIWQFIMDHNPDVASATTRSS